MINKLRLSATIIALIGCMLSGWLLFEKTHTTPTVTVLMATHNRGTILGPSIESILAQTYTDFEFIIINDGSTDNTAEVLKSYQKRDDRIIVLTNPENKGLAYSLNRGIDIARGQYIARMDDDDYSLPFRFERQMMAFKENPEIVALGGNITAPQKFEGLPVEHPADIKIYPTFKMELDTYFGSGPVHPTIIMKTDFLNTHNIRYKTNYLYAEDAALWDDILHAGGKISFLEEVVLIYRYVKELSAINDTEYMHIQHESWMKLRKERVSRFFDVTYVEMNAIDELHGKCLILSKMQDANETKKIIPPEDLEKFYDIHCTPSLATLFIVEHPYWIDTITVQNNRLKRTGNAEGATITDNGDNTVTIKWDKWDTEVYEKTKIGYKYLHDLNGHKK